MVSQPQDPHQQGSLQSCYDSGLDESETPSSKSSSGPRLGALPLPEDSYERTTPDGSVGEAEHMENGRGKHWKEIKKTLRYKKHTLTHCLEHSRSRSDGRQPHEHTETCQVLSFFIFVHQVDISSGVFRFRGLLAMVSQLCSVSGLTWCWGCDEVAVATFIKAKAFSQKCTMWRHGVGFIIKPMALFQKRQAFLIKGATRGNTNVTDIFFRSTPFRSSFSV